MDGLVIGIDISSGYTHLSCMEPEQIWVMKTAVLKHQDRDEWFVGDAADTLIRSGDGLLFNHLPDRAAGEKEADQDGYDGLFLLKMFLKKALELPMKAKGTDQVAQLVIALRSLNTRLMDGLLYCADFLEIPRNRVHIISHTESFSYYVMSQKREVWINQVGLFDFSEEALRYFELKVLRGIRQTQVTAQCQVLEERAPMDVLDHPAGTGMLDQLLCTFSDRILQKRLFSAIILTGRGFDNTVWAPGFMKQVLSRRKVFSESSLFSRGAALKALDCLQEKTAFPYAFICDGRLKASVSVKVQKNDREGQLMLAEAGDNWYEAKSIVDFIVHKTSEVELTVTPLDLKKKKLVKISLEGFPKREDRTVRIQLSVSFLSENTMMLVIKDKGFGEIRPATDAIVRQEVEL